MVSSNHMEIGAPGYLDLRERICGAEKRIALVKDEIGNTEQGLLEPSRAAAALRKLDTLWDALLPKERVRAVQLLVERVAYDGSRNSMSVTFRPCGIPALERLKREDS